MPMQGFACWGLWESSEGLGTHTTFVYEHLESDLIMFQVKLQEIEA